MKNLVKVGAYILGEFGHLVANDPGLAPIDQFKVLHSKSNVCSPATRALLLTTYFKWLNLFPEIRDQILAVFLRYTLVLDAELQQRACEYLAVAKRPDEDLLQVICDEMPPFPERESALLSRLLKRHGDTGDKRTWNIGGRDVNKDKDDERYKGFGRRKVRLPQTDAAPQTDGVMTEAMEPGSDDLLSTSDIMNSLAGLDMSNGAPAAANRAPSSPLLPMPALTSLEKSPSTDVPALGSAISPAPVEYTHGAEKWLYRLAFNPEGILYEDAPVANRSKV